MFQLPEIDGAAGGLANVEGWAKIRGVWAKNGGVWAKIEKVGKECMFVGKGVISLGKENLMICVSSTDHGHLAQYGCDGTHKEAGRGRQLIEPTSLSLPHTVVWLWIWGTMRLQLGQKGALYADRPHDIGSHNNGEEEQASALILQYHTLSGEG